MIELRHLRYFLAAAEHGSFRKAGAALGVRESSVSRGIRDLEAHLGASLFQRQLGGAFLNPAGKRFFEEAKLAMTHLGHGARDVGAIGRSEKGHIRVGIFSSLASGFLSDLFQTYGALHAGVRIDFNDSHPTEHIAAVRRHQLDVAFVMGTARHAGCETTHLWSEQVFAVLPAAHPLADRSSLVWTDLIGETFIISERGMGREVDAFLVGRLSDTGRYPELQWQDVGRDNLMSLVAIGRGLTFTSEAMTSTAFLGLVYRPITGETLPFGAVWSSKNGNPALRRLLNMARARCTLIGPSALSAALPNLLPTAAPSRTPDPSP